MGAALAYDAVAERLAHQDGQQRLRLHRREVVHPGQRQRPGEVRPRGRSAGGTGAFPDPRAGSEFAPDGTVFRGAFYTGREWRDAQDNARECDARADQSERDIKAELVKQKRLIRELGGPWRDDEHPVEW